MDRALARNWLAISQKFEPFIPSSHLNIFQGLGLLQALGEVTQKSLAAYLQRAQELQAKPPAASANAAAPVADVKSPQAPAQSTASELAAAQIQAQAQGQARMTSSRHSLPNDVKLLKALLDLRDSRRVSKRILKNQSPIVRPSST